ncbi:hypothetical protein GP924_28525 [Enterobacteriaceae bacterium 8376wB9]|nr:hypothetical protein [Enterobacteriaceae bacterium 8376wB9]
MKYILCVLFFFVSSSAFADVKQHLAELEKKSNAVRKKIINEVSSEQIRQQNKLAIQMEIDKLRAKIGGESDLKKKIEMQERLKNLQTKKNSL